MNELEARIIMVCRKTKSVKEIIRKLYERRIEREYSHICKTCSLLSDKGLLVKAFINKGKDRGRPSYYTATSEGIARALDWIEDEITRKKSEMVATTKIASLKRYTH